MGLLGEEERGRVAAPIDVGREGIVQDPPGLRHHHVRDEVDVLVGVGRHLGRRDGNAPALLVARAAVAPVVETVVDGVDGDVPYTVAAARIPVEGLAVHPGEEGILKPPCQPPQPIVVAPVLVGGLLGGILRHDGHLQAVVLPHRQPRQPPGLVVGPHDLLRIQHPLIAGADAGVLLHVGAGMVSQHLHHPRHAHLLGIPPLVGRGPVVHARGEGHPVLPGLVGQDVQRDVGQQRLVVVLLPHRDAVGVEGLPIHHAVLIGAVDHVAHGHTDVVSAVRKDDRPLPVRQLRQLLIGQDARVAVGEAAEAVQLIIQRVTRIVIDRRAETPRGVDGGLHLDVAIHLAEVERARDASHKGDVDGRVGEFQGHVLARHLDLQHRDQAHVAVAGVGRHRLVPDSHVLEGGVVAALSFQLSRFVAAGPVEHVEGVPQALLVPRPDLEIDEGRFVGLQAVHLEQQGLLAVEGRSIVVAALHPRGRDIDPVRHAVAVVVTVEGIGRPVPVAVLACVLLRRELALLHRLDLALQCVQPAVVVRVRTQRIQVPPLVVVPEALDLGVVRDAVPVGVLVVGLGAQPFLLGVGEAVAVIVAFGVRVSVVGLQTACHARRVPYSILPTSYSHPQRIGVRIPIRPIQRLAQVLGRPLLVLSPFHLLPLSGLLLAEGVDLLALQEGGDDHRAHDDQDQDRVHRLGAPLDHQEAEQAQGAERQAEPLP